MTWKHSLFRRQTLQYRPISLIVLVTTSTVGFFFVAYWLLSPHVPSQAETKAIQAAWAQYSGKSGQVPGAGTTIKTTKLKGGAWIVQIEYSDHGIGAHSINTYYVSGYDFSCQLLSVVAS